jgi:hypothetical protein
MNFFESKIFITHAGGVKITPLVVLVRFTGFCAKLRDNYALIILFCKL